MVAEGVAAIFGPSSRTTSGIVGSICNAMEIPHITYHWSPEPLGGRDNPHRMTINLFPDSDVLARAMADVIVDYTWKSYTIVYETDESLMRLKDILQIHTPNNDPITVRQLPAGVDFRPLLKSIQASGESHIILDVAGEKVLDILRQADSVKMLEEYQRYILISLDSHTLDFAELKTKNTRSNITSVRLMDVKRFEVTSLVNDWVYGEQIHNRMFRVSPENVKVGKR
jgi:glutamate receptor, ionotropic, invertebrate